MTDALTATAQFSDQLTPEATDGFSDATFGACYQTSADRDEYLRQISLANSLRFTEFGISSVLGAGVHEVAGAVVLLTATEYTCVAAAVPGAATTSPWCRSSASTIPGSPTLSGFIRCAYGGSGANARLVFVCGANSYIFTATLSASQAALAGITTASDVCYSPYSGRFIAVGENGSGYGRIETRTYSSAWTNQASAETTANSYARVACDPTGRYVLAAPGGGAGNTWAYSSDGGATWTTATVVVNSDSTYLVQGLGYDSTRSLWVACFSSLASGNIYVRSNATPLAATWAAASTYPSGLGMGANVFNEITDLAVVRGSWLCAYNDTATSFTGNIVLTHDAGATWGQSLGFLGASSDPLRIHRCGRHLIVGTSAEAFGISGALEP